MGESEPLPFRATDEAAAPAVGEADIWQPDERCVTIYKQTSAVHASEIDIDSRLGVLLEELSKLHPSND